MKTYNLAHNNFHIPTNFYGNPLCSDTKIKFNGHTFHTTPYMSADML